MNQQLATIAVMLILVLAVVGLTVYLITHAPDSDLAKTFSGALLLGFGSAMTHLWGAIKPPNGG